MVENTKSRWFSLGVFSILFLGLSFLVLADTNPLFVSPTPAADSQVTGNVSINFTFDGTGNHTVFVNNSPSTTTQICAQNVSASPQNCTWETLDFDEGFYTINVTVVNSSNASNSNTTLRTVDVEHPVNARFVDPSPTNGSNVSGQVIFNVSYTSIADLEFYYRNETTWEPYFTCFPLQNNVLDSQAECTLNTEQDFAEGVYDFNATIVDSDNSSDFGQVTVYNITIDNTVPSLTLLDPADNTNFAIENVTFNWTMSDNFDSSLTCEFLLNGEVNETLENETELNLTFTDDSYNWSVRCEDDSGNQNQSETRDFVVDTNPPVITEINITPATSNNLTNASPFISLFVNEGNLDSCEYSIGGSWNSLAITDFGSTAICNGTVPVQTEGAQLNFSFNATDIANNQVINFSSNLTVDATLPSVTIESPQASLNTSDGESFFVNATVSEANIVDGTVCTVAIDEYTNSLIGSVFYNATSNACEGTLEIDDPSELPRDKLNFNLTVSVNDTVNNTGSDEIVILVDNLGPNLDDISTNVTGNTVTNETDSILFTLDIFDANKITNVSLSNASTVVASNNSELGFGSAETFQVATTASALGCPAIGACTLQVSLNDSWGNVNDTNTFSIIIDNDFPSYSDLAINTTTAGLKEPIILSALWDDQSLQSSSFTFANLEKFNGSEFVTEDFLGLSNDLQWSNFTYIPTPSEDEGENLTFRISYTDLANRTNTTKNLSVSITNVTPYIVNLTALNLTSGISDENPTIKLQYADEGSLDTVWLNLSGPTINNQTINSNQCALLSVHEESVDEGGFANFTTSSYDATNYSFFVDSIEDAGDTSAKVTFTRYLYGRESPIVLDLGDTYAYEDMNVTLVSTNDSSGDSATLSFTDLGYNEFTCNISYSDLPEGDYNITLNITDSAGNRNASVFSWFVDGFRPNIINLSVEDQFVIQNGNSPSDVSASSGSSFSVNWSLNESNMNSSRIQFIDREEQLKNGTVNNSVFALRPGHHLGKFEAWDVIGEESATAVYFDLFLNSLTNISNISSELQNMSGITFQSFNISRDGVDVTNNESGILNGSIRLEAQFNISSTNVSVNISEFEGTRYNWEEQFFFASNLVDFSLTGVDPQFGVNTSGWYDEDATLENGSYYRNRFIPSNISRPNVNWSVNVTGSPFVVLIENLAQDKYHLLEKCAPDSVVSDFDDACYINNTNSYTILAPDLTGFVLGNDSGDPQISASYPQGTNDSIFSIEFSVIEPSPVSDFCEYSIHENGSLISSGNLSDSDFELVGSEYVFTANFSEYTDDDYNLSVTCEDSLGNNATLEESFTITDTTGPTFIDVNETGIFTGEATVQVAVNEPSTFTIEYGTGEDSLDDSVTSGSLSTTADILIDDLVQDELYFYRIEACDLNGECSFYPSASGTDFFRTEEVSANSGSGGGGGGGGASPEGTIKNSHYHGWSVVPVGPLVHDIDKDDIPVVELSLIIEEELNDGFIRVDTYNGKPSAVPTLQETTYEYFRLSHDGLVGNDHGIEFKVANDYLDEFEGETVFLYRLEGDSWQQYDTQELSTDSEFTTYSTELPGFSYFAIGLELPEVAENTEETQSENNNQTGEQSDEQQNNQSGGGSQEEGEIISYQEEDGFAWWILVVILVAVVLSGGAYYVLTKRPEETSIALDEEDPFYKLQVYINKALDYGHSSEEIREKLLEAGWDDLIVDEEIEKIMSDRI